jgi:hypothetical protein
MSRRNAAEQLSSVAIAFENGPGCCMITRLFLKLHNMFVMEPYTILCFPAYLYRKIAHFPEHDTLRVHLE